MRRLLLHRIIERDRVARMAALPDGLVDPELADPLCYRQLDGELHRPNDGRADAGGVLDLPDAHLTAHSRPDGSMLAARTALSDGVPPCLL